METTSWPDRLAPLLNVARGIFPTFQAKAILKQKGGIMDITVGLYFVIMFVLIDYVHSAIPFGGTLEFRAGLLAMLLLLLHGNGQRIAAKTAWQ